MQPPAVWRDRRFGSGKFTRKHHAREELLLFRGTSEGATPDKYFSFDIKSFRGKRTTCVHLASANSLLIGPIHHSSSIIKGRTHHDIILFANFNFYHFLILSYNLLIHNFHWHSLWCTIYVYEIFLANFVKVSSWHPSFCLIFFMLLYLLKKT